MEDDEDVTATKFIKLADLIQQAIDENDNDSVKIHLWRLNTLFKELKKDHLDYLMSSTNPDEQHKSHKTYEEIEAIVLKLKHAAESYLIKANPCENSPRSSRCSTSSDTDSSSPHDNIINQERSTDSSKHCSTTYAGLPTPSRLISEVSSISDALSRHTSRANIMSEPSFQYSGKRSFRSNATENQILIYRQTVLQIQRRKARMEVEITDKLKEQVRRQTKERQQLKSEAHDEYKSLQEELQRIIEQAKQRKELQKERSQQQEQEMKQRHQQERNRLKMKRQELEFDTEQQLIEAEKAAFAYDEEITGEMPQNLLKLDTHQIKNAALTTREPEPVVRHTSVQRHPRSHETQMQTLTNTEQHISHEYGKFNTNAFLASMIDIIQAPPAEIITFDGNPLKYHLFLKAFDNAVHNRSFDDCAKLTRLVKYCTGEPKLLVESCMLMDASEGYCQARALLEKRYGNRFTITKAWMDKVLQRQQLKARDATALQKFADDLRACKVTLDALGQSYADEMNTSTIMTLIVDRLPSYLQDRWRTRVQQIRTLKRPTFKDLVEFTERAAEEANDPVYGQLGAERTTRGTSAFMTNMPLSQSQRQCQACNENHSIFHCQVFRSMKPTERLNLANERRLCINCLKPGHYNTECHSNRVCPIEDCKQKHTIFLHI